tara:strand:+ start:12094 stop:12237 length:144 start_codon:yes stop_codon:yes gene_type:complete
MDDKKIKAFLSIAFLLFSLRQLYLYNDALGFAFLFILFVSLMMANEK